MLRCASSLLIYLAQRVGQLDRASCACLTDNLQPCLAPAVPVNRAQRSLLVIVLAMYEIYRQSKGRNGTFITYIVF